MFRGSLALVLVFITGVLLQSRSSTTHAGRLTQLVAATPTPLAAPVDAFLFIASGSTTSPTLTRLSPAALRDAVSLEQAASAEALAPGGDATTFPPGCEVAGMHAAPRGPWVAVELDCVHGNVSLVAANHSQTGEMKVLGRQFGSQVVFLGWSPNGQYVILLRDALSDAGAALVNVADDSVLTLNAPGEVYHVALSHDGTRLVYSLTHGLGFGSETWIASIDGSNPRLLSSDPKHIVAYARFSPDDKQLVFIRMPDSNIPFTVGELWLMDADGSSQHLLGQADAGHGYAPAWSPDGSRIAYVFRENGDSVIANQVAERLASNIHIAEVRTAMVQAATAFTSTLVEAPVWSPDGAQLAFAARPPGGVSDVWLYTLANGALARVTRNTDSRYPIFISDR